MCNEHIEGDEWGTYVTLARSAPPERGMAYGARALGSRSPRSSWRWGKPITWRRGTGRRHVKGEGWGYAKKPEPSGGPLGERGLRQKNARAVRRGAAEKVPERATR